MFKTIITKLVNRWFPTPDETPSPQEFHSVEQHLRGLKQSPRPEFERALLQKLRAHHESLQEKRMSHWLYSFRIPRWATASLVIVLLVSGTTLVGAAPAPKSTPESYGGFEATELPDFAPISFTFDQPMMQGSVEKAFTIEPAVEGHFIWKNRKQLLFVPNAPLDPTIEYTVTLSKEAKSLLQKPLKEPLTYQLTPQHVESNESIDSHQKRLEELRQIKDRPLTPEEIEQLHEEFGQMEDSAWLNEWREQRKQERLEEIKSHQDSSESELPPRLQFMIENGVKPSSPLNDADTDSDQSESTTEESDDSSATPSDWNQSSTPTAS